MLLTQSALKRRSFWRIQHSDRHHWRACLLKKVVLDTEGVYCVRVEATDHPRLNHDSPPLKAMYVADQVRAKILTLLDFAQCCRVRCLYTHKCLLKPGIYTQIQERHIMFPCNVDGKLGRKSHTFSLASIPQSNSLHNLSGLVSIGSEVVI